MVDETILTFLVVTVLGGIIVLANRADQTQRPEHRRQVIGTLAAVNVLIIVFGLLQVGSAYLPEPESGDSDPLDKTAAWGSFAVALLFSALATAILFPQVRHALTRIFPRFRGQLRQPPVTVSEDSPPEEPAQLGEGIPLFPQMLNYYTTESRPPVIPVDMMPDGWSLPDESPKAIAVRGFNPQSMVHTVALAMALYYMASQFISFIVSGGLSGVAESFEEGISAWDLILNGFPQIALPLLGVGFLLRRNVRETLQRLGVIRLTLKGVGIAIVATIALLIFVTMAGAAWQMVVPEETYNEQTEASDALAESIDTIGMVFLLAVMAALGEEIAFRGALQPVFGLWPTAIFFALVHLQYTLTPASLMILGVALSFGWIRQNYGLTVAILTHFLYDFIPLALLLTVGEEALIWFGKLP